MVCRPVPASCGSILAARHPEPQAKDIIENARKILRFTQNDREERRKTEGGMNGSASTKRHDSGTER